MPPAVGLFSGTASRAWRGLAAAARFLYEDAMAIPIPSGAPLPDLGNERIAHLTRVAARAFNRSLQMRLADMDMNFGQWIFLRLLWAQDGLSQRELSSRAQVTDPTAHTALVRLEKLGYVDRRRAEGDSRRMYVFLTERGRALRDVLEPLAIEVNETATRGLDPHEIEDLRRYLRILIENLAADQTAEDDMPIQERGLA